MSAPRSTYMSAHTCRWRAQTTRTCMWFLGLKNPIKNKKTHFCLGRGTLLFGRDHPYWLTAPYSP